MKIFRFDITARVLHWSHSVIFLWLLITGIRLFLTPESLLGDPLMKMVHLYASPLFILLPAVIYIIGSGSARRDVGELMSLTDNDLRWFIDFIRRNKSLDTGKFNGGQKANFLFTALLITGLSFSGFVIWMKSMFSVDFVELNFMVHDFFAVLALLLFAGHIGFTLYYTESLRGIIYGVVDGKWAQEHYPRWYEKVNKNRKQN